jgi:hypothetical protein
MMISAMEISSNKHKETNKTASVHGRHAMQVKHDVTLPDAPGSFNWTFYIRGRLQDYRSVIQSTHFKPGR